MYSALAMLYATHVLDGKRTIENVPASIRDQVQEIVNDAKKQEENEQQYPLFWERSAFQLVVFFFERGEKDLDKYLNAASIFTGVLGGVVVSWLGGMDAILHALVALVIVDYLTGLLKAWNLKEISSRIGFLGLIKKVLIFVVIAVAVEVEHVIGDAVPLREVVIMFYLANEGISFLENISVFINFPEQIKDAFLQIRNNDDKGDEK